MARRLATLWLCLLALFSVAKASDALILIRPDNAGPNVPAALEAHPDWVLWPYSYPPGSDNGLLSIFTGQDWRGSLEYLQFDSAAKAEWIARGFRDLSSRGYLARKAVFLDGRSTPLMADGRGSSSADALLLSLSQGGPQVQAMKWDRIVAQDSILVYQAHTWDDVAFVSRRCGGRALVVEFPPTPDARWSRFWMFGRRWTSPAAPASPDLGLNGVVRARDLARLFLEPDSLNWTTSKATPDPWLTRTETFSPTVRGIYLVALFLALAFGSYLVRTEQTSAIFRSFLLLLMGLPAIDLIAGSLCDWVGQNAWVAVVPALACLLLGISALANAAFRRIVGRYDVSLLVVAVIGLAACLFGNPYHSDYSPILSGQRDPVSFEVLGMAGAYAVGILTPVRYWNLRIAVTCALIASAFVRFSGSAPFSELLVGPLALIATLPLTWYTVVSIVLLSGVGAVRSSHFCWSPFGLIQNESDAAGFDLGGLPLQLVSVPFLFLLGIATGLGISTLGFGQHQLLLAYRKSIFGPPLLTLAIYFAACSLIIPGMLAAALTVILGWALVTCYVATA